MDHPCLGIARLIAPLDLGLSSTSRTLPLACVVDVDEILPILAGL